MGMNKATLVAMLLADFIGEPTGAAIGMPGTAEGFTELFAAKNDQIWSGGDQTTSFKAPNGRIYWISVDTMLAALVGRNVRFRPVAHVSAELIAVLARPP
jgi:hypothetical protein